MQQNEDRGKKSSKGLQKDKRRARPQRTRKISLRQKPGRYPGRAVANAPELPAVARLIDSLNAEKIRFIVVGMTAAVLQGAPAATFDIDLWIDLPSRQYMRCINLALRLGAEMISNTIVVLPGDYTINFIYQVTGLHSFRSEYSKLRKLDWFGRKVPVLPLERIYASKSAVRRPKDLAHLPILEQAIELQHRLRKK